jgi:hypothetical protein
MRSLGPGRRRDDGLKDSEEGFAAVAAPTKIAVRDSEEGFAVVAVPTKSVGAHALPHGKPEASGLTPLPRRYARWYGWLASRLAAR